MLTICLCLQPLLHEAVAAPGDSANPPFPPSLKRLIQVADMSPTGRDEQMLVAHSNLTVARYFLHHAAVPPVGTSLLVMCLGLRLHSCTISIRLLRGGSAGRQRPLPGLTALATHCEAVYILAFMPGFPIVFSRASCPAPAALLNHQLCAGLGVSGGSCEGWQGSQGLEHTERCALM